MKDLEPPVSGRTRAAGPRVWIQNQAVRVGLAETLCTYVMMVLGLGSVAQVVTGRGAYGEYLSINVGFGLGVAMGVHVGGQVSGAHMNGAVSLAQCALGRLRWRLLPLYVAAQLLGSFLAAASVYGLYYEAIQDFCGGNLTATGATATAGIFATYPAPYLSLRAGFLDQVFGTAVLLLGLTALADRRNQPAAPGGEPLAAGLLVLLIGVSLGSNSGYAINPTRDIAPRVFTAMAGWGGDVFRSGSGWWWVPLVAPPIGGVLGAGLYRLLVEMHHPPLPPLPPQRETVEERFPLEGPENICTDACV